MAIRRVTTISDYITLKTALISVSDKEGLGPFISSLFSIMPDFTVISTGGTFAHLKNFLNNDLHSRLIPVNDYTGQPEMEGGLVKTLDYKIYLGILSEQHNLIHRQDLIRSGSVPIDMVIVNLYPFEKTVSETGTTFEDARGNIDIGGPCMLRASCKNFHRVLPISDPVQYPEILKELTENKGRVSLKTRYLGAKAGFSHTSKYDTIISDFLEKQDYEQVLKNYTLK